MHPSDTPTTRSCASSLGLTSTIDLSDDALFFRPPRPSTSDLPSLPASPDRLSPPRPPRRRPKPLRKLPRKPVPSFLPQVEGSDPSASDTTPPLSHTPSTSSDSHQSFRAGHRSQVSLDAKSPTTTFPRYGEDAIEHDRTTTPSSKSTLSSLDAELALSTYQPLARVPSPPAKTYRQPSPPALPRSRSTRSLHSHSSSSLTDLIQGPTRVNFVNSTLLSSPGVRPRGDGWIGGPQRPDPKPWFSRVRRSSNASGRLEPTSSIYGVGMGIEHIARTGSHPNLPSMTSSRLDLSSSPPLFSTTLGGIDESSTASGSSTAAENGHAPDMTRSGTFGARTKIHLVKSRPDIPERIRSLSSPRKTSFGTTYDFHQSVLALHGNKREEASEKVESEGNDVAGKVGEAPILAEPKSLAVLERLKARIRSSSASMAARPNTPASLDIGRPETTKHLESRHPLEEDGSSPDAMPRRPVSRLGATSTWRSTKTKLSGEKRNRRLSSFTRTEQTSSSSRSTPSPPSPRSLTVVSMAEFLSTPPASSSTPASLSLTLPHISESINIDDILDPTRRESFIESLGSSSFHSRNGSTHSRSLSDPTSEMMIASPSTLISSLDTPGLDPTSPSVQSEHDIPLETPSMVEQRYACLLAKSGYPSNPHLKSISVDSADETEASFYSALEGEDVSMIHFEVEA